MKETTMQYLLLIYGNEAGMQSASKADMEQMIAAYGAYTQAMKTAGVMVAADRLKPSTAASTVRIADGKTKVLDGPYAETKEQLGGYYLIDVPDLDAALSWAARCPGASLRDGERGHARDRRGAVARRSYGKLVAFLAAPAMSRPPRMRCRRPSPLRSSIGMPAAFPTIPKAGW
jgi:hypothetical protein